MVFGTSIEPYSADLYEHLDFLFQAISKLIFLTRRLLLYILTKMELEMDSPYDHSL